MAWEWSFPSPYQDALDSEFVKQRKNQAQELRNYFSQNDIAQNLIGISQEYGFLPTDVQVAGAMVGLTKDSPEFTSIVNSYMEKERSWWESIKASGRGAIRGAFVGMESASQFVKRFGTAGMRYYSKKQQNPLLFFTGIGTALAAINPDFHTELKNTFEETGPTLAGRAFKEIKKGNKVNLGEGYFGNSTLAEDTEVYKELVGRGADPNIVKEAVQEQLGTPLSQPTIQDREKAALSYQGRKGTVKLSPGRVAAVEIFEPGSKAFKFMSGVIDGAYTIFTDPTTYLGLGISRAGKAVRTFTPNNKPGLINKAVRATVHQPTAKEFYTSQTGRDIADLFVRASTYDEIDILTKGQLKNLDNGAIIGRQLRDADNASEVQKILIETTQDNLGFNKRLDSNSLIFKGKFSRAAGKAYYGSDYGAGGFRTAMKLNNQDSKWGRLFQQFPAPRLHANDLNTTFFELKAWMKFAKVDDEVAVKALDRIADGMEDPAITALADIPFDAQTPYDPRPANLAKLSLILDVIGGDDGVFTHIAEKFKALELPEELSKGIKKFMGSIDETRKYFRTNMSEEFWQGQKLDIVDSQGNAILSQQFELEKALEIVERVAERAGVKKVEVGGRRRLIRDARSELEQLEDAAGTGNIIRGWSRYGDEGVETFEVSTAGDEFGKQFSALNAKFADGDLVELKWAKAKGYTSIKAAKGNEAVDAAGRVIDNFDYYPRYKKIWDAWADENPDLVEQLAVKARGKQLTDKFAKTDNSQARALSEIINERFGKQKIENIVGEGEPIPMFFKVKKADTPFANKDTNTMELIMQGKRTSTTRSLAGYKGAPEVGQIRQLFDQTTGRKVLVRVNNVETLPKDLFTNPKLEDRAREIAKKEGYTYEFYKREISRKDFFKKGEAVRIDYELAGPNNIIDDLNVPSMNFLKDDFLEEILPEATIDRLDPEMEVLVKKVSSGGQEGVDFLGLQIADDIGIETGGVGMPGLTQRTIKDGRYDSNAGQLLKYNVEDSIDDAIKSTEDSLARLEQKITQNTKGLKFQDTFKEERLSPKERARYYQILNKKKFGDITETEIADRIALEIKGKGGLINFSKREDAVKALEEYIKQVTEGGGDASLLKRQIVLENEINRLTKKVEKEKLKKIDKGVLPENYTDEQLQIALRKAEFAEQELRRLNVELEGKNYQGVDQQGKRIKQTTVKGKDVTKGDDRSVREIVDDLQFKAAILRFVKDKSIRYKAQYQVKTPVRQGDGKFKTTITNHSYTVKHFTKNETDTGLSPEFNVLKFLKENNLPEPTGDFKIVREIDFYTFDEKGYREFLGGTQVLSDAQVKLHNTKKQLLKINNQIMYQGNDAANYIKLQDELNTLTGGDIGAMKPRPRDYKFRTTANVDNNDVTIVAFRKSQLTKGGGGTAKTILYASRNRWVGPEWKDEVAKNIDNYNTGVFKKTLNKPLILIDLENPNLTDDFIVEAQKLLRNKTVNIAGPAGFKDRDVLESVLKPLFIKSKAPFKKTEKGSKVIQNAKVTPQQILSFFENKVQNYETMERISEQLFNEAQIENIAKISGRPTAQLIAEYLGTDAIPLPDARLFLRVYSPAREFWMRAAGKGKLIPQRLAGLQADEVIASEFEKELSKPVSRLYELTIKDDKSVSETAELMVRNARKRFKLTKNEEDAIVRELTSGYLGMIGDSYMNKAWKPAILLRAAWTSRVVGEEQIRMWMDNLDNVFSHPLSAFAWIMGKDQRRIAHRLRGYDEDEFAERLIAKGVYDIEGNTIGEGIEHGGAMTTSHGGVLDPNQSFARQGSFLEVNKTDDTFYGGAAGEVIQLGDDPIAAEIAYKLTGFNGTFRGELISMKKFTPAIVKNNPNKMFVFGDNIARTGKGGQAIIRDEPNVIGVPTKHSARKFFTDDDYDLAVQVIDEAFQEIDEARGLGKVIVLPEDGLGTGRAGPKDPKTGKYTGLEKQAPRINNYLQRKLKALKEEQTEAVLDETVSAEDAIKEIKDRFWDGDLSEWRTSYSYGSDEIGKYQKIRMLTDRKAADAYIDGIVARIHYKTGGHFETKEVFEDGTFKVLHRSDGSTGKAVTRTSPTSIIVHDIIKPGDDELIRHIAFGKRIQATRDMIPAGKPTRLKIGVDPDGNPIEITFGRNQTLDDHRTYKGHIRQIDKDREIYGAYHTMKKSTYDINAQTISKYDQVLENLFTTLMAVPTNRLSRSSAFRQYYWRFIEENGAYYDEALKNEIISMANMKASKWVKNSGETARILKGTKPIRDGDARILGVENISELDDAAKAYALSETKRLLYDLNKRHVVSDMLRLAFPFAEVYQEIIGTWSRLINQQKLLAGRKVQRVIQGARGSGEEGEEGFFHTDEMSGEEMFFFPGTELLTNYMFGEEENRLMTNPITGDAMEAPDVRIKLEGYASSLNMVAGNPVPGLGPLVAIPAAKLLPDTALLDKIFFPYGREEGSPVSPYTYLDAMIPSWLKKVFSISGASTPEIKRTYANTYKDVLRMLITTGLYDDSTREKQQDAMKKAEEIATRLSWVRAAVQFAAPTGAVVRYEIETTPGGALYLDPAEFQDSDPDGYYFGMSIYADAYYRILAKYKGDQLAATTEFVNQFGIDPTALLTSKSKEIQKRSYTEVGGRFTRENQEVLDRYPNIGYYIFPDNPLDEFDFTSWANAFAERDRVDIDEDEYVAAIRNAQGRLAYEYQRRLLFDTPAYANVPSKNKFEMLTAVRNALIQEYPGYGISSTIPTSMNVEAKIREFEDMLRQDGETNIKLPDGKTTKLKQLPAVQGAIAYMEQRNRLLTEARLVLGSNVSLQREELVRQRTALRQLAQQLFSEYPDFYYVYLDLFKYEVEEEFVDTTLYGGS